MKQIVEQIYSQADSSWDGMFDSLDGHVKDSAVRRYLLTDGKPSLEDVFPACCSGAETLLLNALYDDQHQFILIYAFKTIGHTPKECFTSEALYQYESEKLEKACFARDTFEVTKIFGDALYRYCEDSLSDGCAEWFDIIQAEWAEQLAEEDQFQHQREAVYQ